MRGKNEREREREERKSLSTSEREEIERRGERARAGKRERERERERTLTFVRREQEERDALEAARLSAMLNRNPPLRGAGDGPAPGMQMLPRIPMKKNKKRGKEDDASKSSGRGM